MKKSNEQSTVLHCKCGYRFAVSKPARRRSFQSFAVICDKHYERFLSIESRVLAATNEKEKMRAIAQASELVGSLFVCPECGRLTFRSPGGKSKAYYLQDRK